MTDIAKQMTDLARETKAASRKLVSASGEARSRALDRLAELLQQEKESIFEANAEDLRAAEASGMAGAMLDRLRLGDKEVGAMIQSCREVARMEDPVGSIDSMWKRQGGMLVGRMVIPLGVVAMIYESRPNVTVEAGILCIKAGNGTILRGGSEAQRSNRVLADLFSRALRDSGLPGEALCLVPTTEREAVQALLHQEEYIDVVIPRGGEGLIRAVMEQARMPVLKHYKGVCHIYVDRSADLEQALDIVENAKVQKPGVCNAVECLLVHEDVAGEFLPALEQRLGQHGVAFRAEEKALSLMGGTAQPANKEDFGYEFLDLILAVKVVSGQDEAQEHIAEHGSNHTEGILTRDHERAMRFIREVDASLTLINASTRFNDGGQLGLGAEIGISTSKLHAYGPMGIRELTSTKFVLFGEGQIRG
ncbi:MAG: glutamate-5-semialdehyde dehydrogenase [Desulfohalobiaceae bacterium]|nr:glutamate-5-semialdehyde dehydrogenase [Desulfohalobiaceae bacterium]